MKPSQSLPSKTVFHSFRDNLCGPPIEVEAASGLVAVLERDYIWERSTRFARALADAGVGPGDRVISLLPTSADFLFTLFATWMRRAVIVPLPHVLQSPRIRRRVGAAIKTAKPKVVIAAPDMAGALEDVDSPFLQPSFPTGFVEVMEPEPDDIAYLQFTSGSTGEPRGAIIRHAQVEVHNQSLVRRMSPSSVMRVVSWLPVHHDMGFIGGVLFPISLNSPLRLIASELFLQNPTSWLKAITEFQATVSPAPTFAYSLLANRVPESRLKGIDLSSWRYANVGAEPVFWSVLEAFQRRFSSYGLSPTTLHPSYGLAEATLAASLSDVDVAPKAMHVHQPTFRQSGKVEQVEPGTPGAWAHVSNGTPLPSLDLQVTDPQGERLEEGNEGRLRIRGEFVSQGYFGEKPRPEEWLDTGDLGFQMDGETYVTGRTKDLLIRGGQNVHPQEIETAASTLPQIRIGSVAAFCTVPKTSDRERIILMAETRLSDAKTRSELRSQVGKKVAEETEIQVDEVVLIPAGTLPKTTSGKIERQLCRTLFESGELKDPTLP